MKHIVGRPSIYLLTVVMVSGLVGCAGPGHRRRAQRQRDDGAPKVGDIAPPFALKMFDDQGKTVELAAFREEKPVVLFFGSYT